MTTILGAIFSDNMLFWYMNFIKEIEESILAH